MSTLAKALLAILSLSVVAGGVGLVSTFDESPVDRSRPVIIGRVGDVDDDRSRGGGDQPRDDPSRQESPAPQKDPAPSPGVVTPKPRDLTGDDLDAPEDGDDTDAGEDGPDDDSSEDDEDDEDDDDDDAGDGGEGGDD